MALVLAVVAGAPATAADLTWSGGSAGDWDYSTENWTTTGVTFAAGDSAIFNTANAVVTLTTNIDATNITFGADGITIQPTGTETLTFGGTPSVVEVTNTGETATISTVIDGSGDITLQGNGTLDLTATNVATGTITISRPSDATTLVNDGTWGGNIVNTSTGTFTNNGTVAGTVANAGTMTSSGTIGGTFTQTGSGTLATTGDLTVSGSFTNSSNSASAVVVTAGDTLQADTFSSTNGTVTVGAGSTLKATNATPSISVSGGSLVSSGTLVGEVAISGGASGDLSGTVTGNLAVNADTANTTLTVSDAGATDLSVSGNLSLTQSGMNTATIQTAGTGISGSTVAYVVNVGGTFSADGTVAASDYESLTINAGTFEVFDGYTESAGATQSSVNVTYNTLITQQTTGAYTTFGSDIGYNLTVGSSGVATMDATLAFTDATKDALSVDGMLTVNDGVVVTGVGALSVNGTLDIGGGTSGSLTAKTVAIGTTGTINLATGAALTATQNTTYNAGIVNVADGVSITEGGSYYNGSTDGTDTVATAELNFNGNAIASVGAPMTFDVTGTIYNRALLNFNTDSDTTNILSTTDIQNSATGVITVYSGATVDATSASTAVTNNGDFSVNSGGTWSSGTVTTAGTSTDAATTTVAGTMNANQVVDAYGTLDITGAVNGTVETKSGGTLAVSSGGSISGTLTNAGDTTVTATGSVAVGQFADISNSGTFTISATTPGNNVIFNNDGAFTLSGSGSLIGTSGDGITFANLSGGSFTVSGGTMTGIDAFTNAGTVTVANAQTLTAGTFTNTATVSLDGTIDATVTNGSGGSITTSGDGGVITSLGNTSGTVTVIASSDLQIGDGTTATLNNTSGTVNIDANGSLTALLANASGGTVNLDGTVSGAVTNAGTFSLTGTAQSTVSNTSGTLTVDGGTISGTLSVSGGTVATVGNVADSQFANVDLTAGTFEIGAASPPGSASFTNGDTFTVSGTGTLQGVSGDTVNFYNTGTFNMNGGSTANLAVFDNSGTLNVADAQTLTATSMTNTGTVNLDGAISGAVSNDTGGIFKTTGNGGSVTSLTNTTGTSSVTIASGTTLTVGNGTTDAIANDAGDVSVIGTLTGSLANASGATASITGEVTGNVTNLGDLTVTGGLVDGTLDNQGQTTTVGNVAATDFTKVDNTGTFTISAASAGGTVTFNNGGEFNQTAGTLAGTSGDTVKIDNTGTFNVDGGSMTNIASFTSTGTVSVGAGDTLSASTITLTSGTTTIADGATLDGTVKMNTATLNYAGTTDASITITGDFNAGKGDITTLYDGVTNTSTLTIYVDGTFTYNNGGYTENGVVLGGGGDPTSATGDGVRILSKYISPCGGDATLTADLPTNYIVCADSTYKTTVGADISGLSLYSITVEGDKGSYSDIPDGVLLVSGGSLTDLSQITNDGYIQITGGNTLSTLAAAAATTTEPGTLTNDGQIDIDNGTLSAVSILNASGGIINIGTGGTLQGTGNTTYNAGDMNVADGGSIVDAGSFYNGSTDGTDTVASAVLNFNGNAINGTIGAPMTFDIGGDIINRATINFNADSDTTNIVNASSIQNANGATIEVFANATADATAGATDIAVSNAGNLTVDANGTWISGTVTTTSTGTTTVDGAMRADQVIDSSGQLLISSGGTVTGNVTNGGTLNLGGTIAGNLTDSTGDITLTGSSAGTPAQITGSAQMSGGTLTIGTGEALSVSLLSVDGGAMTSNGALNGSVAVGTGGTFETAGSAAAITGSLTTSGTVNVFAGDILTVPSVTIDGGTTTIAGEVTGSVTNNGGSLALNAGTIDGGLANAGAVTTSGTSTVVGAIQNTGSGTFAMNGDLSAASFTNASSSASAFSMASGQTLTVTSGFATTAGTSQIDGIIAGDALFGGGSSVLSSGTGGSVTGALAVDGGTFTLSRVASAPVTFAVGSDLTLNGATIDLSGADATAGDTLTVGGNLIVAGNSTIVLDVNGSSSDVVDVAGGYSNPGGELTLDVNIQTISSAGNPVLLDFGDATGITADSNGIVTNVLANYTGSAAGLYIPVLKKDTAAQTVYLSADLSNSVGATVANIALSQTLLNTIINRPSSPFVSGLAVQDGNQCSRGTWARLFGGGGTVSGTGRQDIRDSLGAGGKSNLPGSDIEARFGGLVGGFDFGCFDGRSAGWDLVTGAIVGYNRGSTSQDIYEIGGGAAQTRTTSTFNQGYLGGYVAASNDKISADLKLRFERTDFSLTNKDLITGPGNVYAANGLDGTGLGSEALTLSGSVSYFMALNEDSSFGFVPTGGFGYTRTRTDSLTFPGTTAEIKIQDHATTIGFLGGTLARTKLNADGVSATTMFATATYYDDFSSEVVTNFTDDSHTGTITTDPLGSFVETSLGVSYVRILDKGQIGKARQLDVSGRIDARFSDSVHAVGVTVQGRLQF